MEAEQHTAKWPRNHRRNQKRNKNMHRNEWKWKHNNAKPMGCSKSNNMREGYGKTNLSQETRKTTY